MSLSPFECQEPYYYLIFQVQDHLRAVAAEQETTGQQKQKEKKNPFSPFLHQKAYIDKY